MNIIQILKRACTKHLDHADNIMNHETEYRHALARSEKCRSRGDDRGHGTWMQAARQHLLASMKSPAESGIVGDHRYADSMHKYNLIVRME
jgi:hypothetical protein